MSKRSILSSVAVGAAVAAAVGALIRRPTLGSRRARRRFIRRNRPFLSTLPTLRRLIRLALDRGIPKLSTDSVVYLLARRAADDFEEILVLDTNGYGFGSLSLLRGMYERVVTAFHLHENPGDTDAFTDYHWVQRRKLARAIGDSIEKPLSPELLAQLEHNYDTVKTKYEVKLCSKCGAKGVNFRWHKLGVVDMAKGTAVQAIRDLLVRAYYIPLEHAHSTAGSLLFQVEEKNGALAIKQEQDSLWADHAVAVAQLLVLLAIAALRLRLNLAELQQPIDNCAKDHRMAWPNL